LTINQKYLKHDFYTDIITFDLSSDETIIGEIYISLERVKENAGLLNINFSQELMRVIFHGALHLAGLNDKTPQQKAQMTQQENKYLTLL
jgi:rRNA maturation RNase YbeY